MAQESICQKLAKMEECHRLSGTFRLHHGSRSSEFGVQTGWFIEFTSDGRVNPDYDTFYGSYQSAKEAFDVIQRGTR